MWITHLVLISVLVAASATHAQEFPWADRLSDGFRHNARVAYVKASKSPAEWIERKAPLSGDAKRPLDALFEYVGSRALIVSMDGAVVFERYAQRDGVRRTPLGMSMSKSLTALAIGQALCEGKIRSLDDKLQDYVPPAAGTSWGAAPIRAVLKMASGAYATSLADDGHKTAAIRNTLGSSLLEGRMNGDFFDLLRQEDARAFKPGEQWNYSNFDTVALGLLLEHASAMSMAQFFQARIWQQAGAESDGAWIVNNKRQPSTYHGFSASPRDWLRLGHWVLAELDKTDSCFGKYLKEATSPQIGSFGAAQSYGYQTWVNCAPQIDFCFVGYGGQYLLFNTKKKIVAYHHAATPSQRVWNIPTRIGGFIQQHVP